MTEPVLFLATNHVQDISIARREPDGTLRRAEYANINWLDRLSRGIVTVVSLNPETDLRFFNIRMNDELGKAWWPDNQIHLAYHCAGYFTALKRHHGSNYSLDIAQPKLDIEQISEALGVPVANYRPAVNSMNKLNWTLRLWERTKD